MSRHIFVFGSNLAGRHGAGSALEAARYWGARNGIGSGYCGDSYAIPTKDRDLKVLPLHVIAGYIGDFLQFAEGMPTWTFHIVKIGCGLAGYKDHEIEPLFKDAPMNCALPPGLAQMTTYICATCSRKVHLPPFFYWLWYFCVSKGCRKLTRHECQRVSQ